MQKTIIAFLFVFSTLSTSHAQDRGMIKAEDTATIDGVMEAYYEAVSGNPGKRDVARILNLYAPNAKLNVNVMDGKPVHGIVEEVVMGERFQNISTDFFEREISRDEHRFGNLANVISTYGISDAMENTEYTARGITLFQMYYADNRWWVLSSVWQRESDELPIPAHLLD